MKTRSQRRAPPTPKRAFTLVELLVVIAIIALLSALLTPSLSSAKQRAHQVTCLNNLRQIGYATTMYMDDHDASLPSAVDFAPWRAGYPGTADDLQVQLNNYVGKNNGSGTNNMSSPVWRCPAAMKDQATVGIANYPNKICFRWNSYETRGPNSMWDPTDTTRVPRRIPSVSKPSMAALSWCQPDWVEPGLHFSKLDCLFVDGHVEPVAFVPSLSPINTLWWYAGDQPGEGWAQ